MANNLKQLCEELIIETKAAGRLIEFQRAQLLDQGQQLERERMKSHRLALQVASMAQRIDELEIVQRRPAKPAALLGGVVFPAGGASKLVPTNVSDH